ncbi:polysaccharide biosynthesis/export family protein [Candidatus Venteria ishoeyi]|uniref:Polysaccharide biosynthesis/export protein n=1 Tax=Candidatus Venteria ishoeyi TaxID=1899563 RepID=A0A1H6FD51_9GAMM|nr:polysaccharide biosynthesis/export family protein [Candidatus Venteria ishoeyi]MDM8546151.1 polysaccharide biosynthesis/export family protein [Candidatus Venteria ishoeyi]SEH08020.1 Polysaccharide biosynthesis/export protein [Candidatus Venteria ishoeyi]
MSIFLSKKFFLVCLLTLFLAACSSKRPPAYQENPQFPPPPKMGFGALQPGDSIDIRFRYWSELDDSQTIRPDGKITLPIVDDVVAAGLMPEELDAELTHLYSEELKDPEISVVVRMLANRTVYVGGEVFTPGEVEMKNKMTLMQAVMAAGGFNMTSAEVENVVVIRQADNMHYATTINLKKILQQPNTPPFYLAALDVVYVPRTKIVQLNQWIDQYITRMLPDTRSFNIGVVKTVGNTSYSYGLGN